MYKLCKSDRKTFNDLLSTFPSVINSLRDDVGYTRNCTLLMYSVTEEDTSTFKYLLSFPQDFNCVDVTNWNMFHWVASNFGSYEMMSLLVDGMKSLNISNDDIISSANGKTVYGYTPLHVACWENDSRRIEFLVEIGADVNARNDDGRLPEEMYSCNDETKKLMREIRQR